jgi:ring-1,2-phenylacetyl-CoA epoxidase subunit PaaC
MGYGNPPDEPETGAGSDAPPEVAPLTRDAGSVVPSFTTRGADDPLVEYLLRIGDDRLVLGHRLSEWCGHAPILEEDIALANLALDCVGQAALLLKLAGEVEGKGRTEDDLAYLREAVEFRNVLLVELPRGDFAMTIARQFLVDAFARHFFAALRGSAHAELAGIAAKCHKEVTYHLRHSTDWMLKLGDGTHESHRRLQRALDECWPYAGEWFEMDDVDRELLARGVAVDLEALREPWMATVREVVEAATLALPTAPFTYRGGRRGKHTEHLGRMLAEMQIVARSHPGAQW